MICSFIIRNDDTLEASDNGLESQGAVIQDINTFIAKVAVVIRLSIAGFR